MSIASEITRLQNAKDALKTSINAKTDASHQITTELIDDYATFVDTISTGGGSYNGQLPQNSTITNLVCVGSDIRVYLAVDALADGTRVYYKENALPTLNDSYVDVPANSSYAVIPNVHANSMYGFRCASYVIYDTDQKAFNNAQSIGSYAIKTTTIFNSEGCILLDIPVEDQGKSITALCYSEYSKKVYLLINTHLYKLDTQDANPGWTRIGSSYTFVTSSVGLSPTSAGIFLSRIRSSGNLLLYKEDTDTFIDTGIGQNYYITQLSNGDIITAYLYDSYYGVFQKFNESTNTFSNLVNYNHYIGAAYGASNIIDNGSDIYISLLYQDGTNMLPTRVLKYNQSTQAYDLFGQFPKPASSQTSAWTFLSTIIPLVGYNLYKSGDVLYKLVNGSFVSLGGFCLSGTKIAQDLNNPEMVYGVGSPGSTTENYIYKINVNTAELAALYTLSGYYAMHRKVTYYDNKVLAPSGSSSYGSQGYYDIPTSTWYGSGLASKGVADYESTFKVINGNCYGFGRHLYKYVPGSSDFTISELMSLSQNTSYIPTIATIQNGNKVYIYDSGTSATNTRVGICVLDTATDTVTRITSTPYRNAVVKDNKIYFLGAQSGVNQFIVDLTDDSYSVSQHLGGSNYFGGMYTYPTGYTLNNKTASSSFVDTALKKITSYDKDLLDYSASTKTFSVSNYSSFNTRYTGAYLVDADKTEIIVCFTE